MGNCGKLFYPIWVTLGFGFHLAGKFSCWESRFAGDRLGARKRTPDEVVLGYWTALLFRNEPLGLAKPDGTWFCVSGGLGDLVPGGLSGTIFELVCCGRKKFTVTSCGRHFGRLPSPKKMWTIQILCLRKFPVIWLLLIPSVCRTILPMF